MTEQEQNGDKAPLGRPAAFPGTRPPDLAQVVAAWPRLPDAIKTGMVAMVKAALQTGEKGRLAVGGGVKPLDR